MSENVGSLVFGPKFKSALDYVLFLFHPGKKFLVIFCLGVCDGFFLESWVGRSGEKPRNEAAFVPLCTR